MVFHKQDKIRANRYRINKRKRPGKKKNGRMSGMLAACVRIAAGAAGIVSLSFLLIFAHDYLTQCDFFIVEQVEIDGMKTLTRKQVLQQTDLSGETNILSLNLGVSRQRIEAHPWVRKAAIRRELPDKVFISITEHEPLAVVDVGKQFILNTDGEMFKKYDSAENPVLPVIHGLDLSDLPLPGEDRGRNFDAAMTIIKMGQKPESILPIRLIQAIYVDHELGVSLATDHLGYIKLGFGRYPSKYGRLRNVLVYLAENKNMTMIDWVDLNDLNRIIVNPAENDGINPHDKEV